MDRALLHLLFLHLTSGLRQTGRSLRTVRGAGITVLGLAGLFFWMRLVIRGAVVPADEWLAALPALLVVFLFVACLNTLRIRGVYFPPAEIQHFFPAPLRRRSLLMYRFCMAAGRTVGSAGFSTVVFWRLAESPWALFLGLFLFFLFLAAASQAFGLLVCTLDAPVLARGRAVMAGLMVVLVGVPLGWAAATGTGFADLLASPMVQGLASPMGPFLEVMRAPGLLAGLAASWPCLLMIVGALLLVLFFDARFEDAAVAAAARMATRIRQEGTGSGWALAEAGPGVSDRWFNWLGLSGAYLWKQVTGMRRSVRGLLRNLAAVALFLAVIAWYFMRGGEKAQFYGFSICVLVGTLLLLSLLRFDFRGDGEVLARLKTIPVPPGRVVLGQVLVPFLGLTLFQMVVLGWWYGVLEPGARWRGGVGVALWSAPLFNLVLVGLENALFLMRPTAGPAAGGLDAHGAGVRVLFLMIRGAFLGGLVLACWLSRHYVRDWTGSDAAGTATVLLVLAVWAVATLRWLARLFARLDLGRVPVVDTTY